MFIMCTMSVMNVMWYYTSACYVMNLNYDCDVSLFVISTGIFEYETEFVMHLCARMVIQQGMWTLLMSQVMMNSLDF
jgi:hypothetical protein